MRPEPERGDLVEAFAGQRSKTKKGYFLAFPSKNRQLPALLALSGWLREELAADGPAAR